MTDRNSEQVEEATAQLIEVGWGTKNVLTDEMQKAWKAWVEAVLGRG